VTEVESKSFNALLTILKDRSGKAYEKIAIASGLGRAAIHRYCTGQNLPPSEEVVHKLADALDATPEERADLVIAWLRAKNLYVEPVPTPLIPDAPGPAPHPPNHWWMVAGVCSVVIGVVIALTGLHIIRGGRPIVPADLVDSSVAAPWRSDPTLVDPALFGVTVANGSGQMPTFKVGSVRLWDSGTRWSLLQPDGPGTFDWGPMDRVMAGANNTGHPVVYTFGSTPAWASPGGPEGVYGKASRTSAPDDLRNWDAFVRALSTKYKGRINAYELWVMIGDERNFSGSVPEMVEMTRRASQIIRGTDPGALLICPSIGQLWKTEGLTALKDFTRLRGYDYCDAMGVKMYQRSAADPPETMLALAKTIRDTFAQLSVRPLPIWSTGTTNDIPLATPLSPTDQENYAVRFYLVGMYARFARMYLYSWGGGQVPIKLQYPGEPATRAAVAMQGLQEWLIGAKIYACGHGSAYALPENVYRCMFLLPADRGTFATIMWTSTGVATVHAEYGGLIHRLDGTNDEVKAGKAITVTGSPILVAQH
jgi:transcriptional regulator with XRE-family HTH domain